MEWSGMASIRIQVLHCQDRYMRGDIDHDDFGNGIWIHLTCAWAFCKLLASYFPFILIPSVVWLRQSKKSFEQIENSSCKNGQTRDWTTSMVTHGDYAWLWTRWRSQFQAYFVFDIIYIDIFDTYICVYIFLALKYIYSWLLKTYLWFSWPRMIVDFNRTDRRFPPFQRATQLWLNRSLPRGEKKTRTIALLVQRFCLFCPQKNYHQLFHYILLSLMFSHVSVCPSLFPFFIQRWPPIESSWPRPCCSGRGSPKSVSFASGEAGWRKHEENGEKKIVVQYSRRVWEVDANHLICYPLHISVFRSVELHIVKLKNLINSRFPHFQWFSCLPFFSFIFSSSPAKNRLFPPSH